LNFGQAILHVPSRWEITTVGSQAELVEYGTGSKTGSLRRDDDIPVLRMGNIKEGRLDWTNMKYLPADHADFPRLLLQPGDLLFNRTNSAEHVGKSAVFAGEVARASAASYLIRVRFRSGVNPAWANMVINSLYGREFVASVVSQQVGQANVNGTKLKRFPLPLPPLAEQDQLVDRYDGATEVIDRQLLALGGVMDRSASLRRSLLAAAFDGRLSAEPIEAFARV
jgi:type I restriction enzyme S subunit